jgi:hypothetical protein
VISTVKLDITPDPPELTAAILTDAFCTFSEYHISPLEVSSPSWVAVGDAVAVTVAVVVVVLGGAVAVIVMVVVEAVVADVVVALGTKRCWKAAPKSMPSENATTVVAMRGPHPKRNFFLLAIPIPKFH